MNKLMNVIFGLGFSFYSYLDDLFGLFLILSRLQLLIDMK